ncbi:dihydrolipoyl dehydrogenase family protein [Guptibacillus algicola]|uniref:dihydrolipoyl dehydrogenase family protein n=1 Tax=Guptibacillus algicola TaxID=225844 RepID=UPI001CD1C42F|nr:NAD(P)/FAD-dependent oxidoreductase [Alkalihalobacillus algicola]MCA0987163.1 NAD(P)/FAD-dependent oxidoreductase [Alkalihalobacillus algicola]
MMKSYDLIVIGSGSGGSVTAGKCKKAGWSVAMIDSRPFGGTCALRGCDPKKVLVGAAELMDWNNRMEGHGIQSEASIDWNELMKFKKTFTEPVPKKKEESLNESGIDTYHGKASFVSENEVQVGDETLKGSRILIATGAGPSKLNIEGEENFTYSDEFLDLEELPKKIIFVGGGYISFEFAHVAARSGAEVHIVHRGERTLENFDSDLVDILMEKSKEIGIQVHLKSSVASIEKRKEGYTVTATQGEDSFELEGDLVVHGAGRRPSLDMDLEKANVEYDKKGVKVNRYLQSVSNPHVYAAGDVAATDGLPLTPVAGLESHVVSSNLLKGNEKEVEYPVLPSVVFTVPKIATVGLSEREAKERNPNVKVIHEEVSNWFTYRRTNESHAAIKLLIDEENDLVVGAHLISNEADELINHFATAIQFKITTKQLKKMIYAYPTSASDIAHML